MSADPDFVLLTIFPRALQHIYSFYHAIIWNVVVVITLLFTKPHPQLKIFMHLHITVWCIWTKPFVAKIRFRALLPYNFRPSTYAIYRLCKWEYDRLRNINLCSRSNHRHIHMYVTLYPSQLGFYKKANSTNVLYYVECHECLQIFYIYK